MLLINIITFLFLIPFAISAQEVFHCRDIIFNSVDHNGDSINVKKGNQEPFTGKCEGHDYFQFRMSFIKKEFSDGRLLTLLVALNKTDTVYFEDRQKHDSVLTTKTWYNQYTKRPETTTVLFEKQGIKTEKTSRVFPYTKTVVYEETKNFANGRRIERLWHTSGNLWIENFYQDNLRDSIWREWYDDGSLMIATSYSNNNKNGEENIWWSNGQLQKQCFFKNSKLQGTYLLWHQNGKLEKKEFYVNGQNEGSAFCWYKTGKLSSKGNYKKGKMHGTQKVYYYNGNLQGIEVYNSGEKDGICISWDENENIQMKASYKNGKMNGISSYYVKARKVVEINYKDGMFNGHFRTWWFSNEKMKTDIIYEMNIRNGKCRKWNENGDLIFERSYLNGKVDSFILPDSVIVNDTCSVPAVNLFSQSKSVIKMIASYYNRFNIGRTIEDSLSGKMVMLLVAAINSSQGAYWQIRNKESHILHHVDYKQPDDIKLYERVDNYSILRLGLYEPLIYFIYDDGEADQIQPIEFEQYCQGVLEADNVERERPD